MIDTFNNYSEEEFKVFAADATNTILQELKEVIKKYVEVWEKTNLPAYVQHNICINTAMLLVAEGLVVHLFPQSLPRRKKWTKEALKAIEDNIRQMLKQAREQNIQPNLFNSITKTSF